MRQEGGARRGMTIVLTECAPRTAAQGHGPLKLFLMEATAEHSNSSEALFAPEIRHKRT